MSRRLQTSLAAVLVGLAAAGWWGLRDAGDDSETMMSEMNSARRLDLSAFPDTPPRQALDLLFIHHSCGGQLLASAGPESGTNCICPTDPNGGGLRSRLQKNSFVVHEASYGSRVGQDTDIFDWVPKFRDRMEEVLTCDFQDQPLPTGRRNSVVLFKSCFPNNNFTSVGQAPGNPAGPELTLWNAKAAYEALLPEFRKHPRVLFVCFTAPPLVRYPQPVWKQALKRLLGRQDGATRAAGLARDFNTWLVSQDGWLKNYELPNVVVFDYYDLLTEFGKSNFSRFPSSPIDSHPSRDGNENAAAVFVPFLNRAVYRAGMAG
jgi:hypothetical protein